MYLNKGKNSYFLNLIRYRSLADEYDPQNSKIDSLIGKYLKQNE